MGDAEKESAGGLTRQELLNAIDFELAQRESWLSRHGISTWGIGVATAALIWTSAVEALSAEHNWTHVLLVLIATNWILGFLVSPWMKALGIGVKPDAKDHPRTFRESMLRYGFTSEFILYHVLYLCIMLGVAVYLGFQGFYLLAVSSGLCYATIIILLLLLWLLFCVRLPLRLSSHAGLASPPRLKIYVHSLSITIALVPLSALASAWPIDKPDVRLGLILAGLLLLVITAIQVIQPSPLYARLRSLRSRVGMGQCSIDTATTELRAIICGPPEEHYLTEKAEEIADILRESASQWNQVTAGWQRLIALSAKLKLQPTDTALLKEITAEFRPLVRQLLRQTRSVDEQAVIALKLYRQLLVRIDAANSLLNLRPGFTSEIAERTKQFWKDMERARAQYADIKDNSWQDVDALFEMQRNVKLPSSITFREAYAALFRR